MGYEKQMQMWLKTHPRATLEDAWKAGYMQCTDNWCNRETFREREEKTEPLDYEGFRKVYSRYSDLP